MGQLRHRRSLRTGPLLAPEIAAAPQAFYLFRDLLALRTFVHLREHASLQKIRAAIGNLRDLGEVAHLASYRLVSDVAGNIQLVTEKDAVDLVRNSGQQQILVVMGDVIEAFPARAGVVVPHLLQPREHLTEDPRRRAGCQ